MAQVGRLTLHELCSIPTAPFVEDAVIAYCTRFAADRGLRISRDSWGNLLLEAKSRPSRAPRWVFAAHMDHPGFIAHRMLRNGWLEAFFRGGVKAEYFKGSRVRFFEGGREIGGVVERILLDKVDRRPYRATIRVARDVSPGAPGMWDQGIGRTRRGKFYSRACDDLAGAAAALTMLDELTRRAAKVPAAVLLTRAEEEGFIGAIAASQDPQLLRRSDRIIAIECSAAQPYAPQGKGAIIRVGDRTSIFNSDLTYFITQQAADLTTKDKQFKYQRALMPGGTCEATVYDVYGFTAASICVPLANYHNMNSRTGRIAPEFIDLGDWQNMVKLFVHLAQNAHRYRPGHHALRQRIEKRFARLKRFL